MRVLVLCRGEEKSKKDFESLGFTFDPVSSLDDTSDSSWIVDLKELTFFVGSFANTFTNFEGLVEWTKEKKNKVKINSKKFGL